MTLDRRGAAPAGRWWPARRLLGLGLIFGIALSPLAGLIFGLFALLWTGAARVRSHAGSPRAHHDAFETLVPELMDSEFRLQAKPLATRGVEQIV